MNGIANITADALPGQQEQANDRPAAVSVRELFGDVKRTSAILKALGHESRLIILCTLLEGAKSVSELESILELRQPAVSQQLARLRGDRLVRTYRQGKMIYYSLVEDEDVRAIVAFLCNLLKNAPRPGDEKRT